MNSVRGNRVQGNSTLRSPPPAFSTLVPSSWLSFGTHLESVFSLHAALSEASSEFMNASMSSAWAAPGVSGATVRKERPDIAKSLRDEVEVADEVEPS